MLPVANLKLNGKVCSLYICPGCLILHYICPSFRRLCMKEMKPKNLPSYSVLATVWRKKISRRFHMTWISSLWCSLETRHQRRGKCHECAWVPLNKFFPEHTAQKPTCPWLTEISEKLDTAVITPLKLLHFPEHFSRCSKTLILRRQVQVLPSKAYGEWIME